MSETVDYEYDFDPDAENNTAATIHGLAHAGGPSVLDLGSGPGIVSSHLATAGGKTVTCADAEPRFLERARARGVEHTVEIDLDDPTWVDSFEDCYDVVILADVLEHLRDPAAVLRMVRDHPLVAPDGRVVVSIPNAGFIGVIAELMAGRFTYSESGLLDSTHIRFFTEASFKELAASCGFIVGEVHRITKPIEQSEFFARLTNIDKETMATVQDSADEASSAYQLVFLLRPATEAGHIADLLTQQEQMRAELALKELHLAGARSEIDRVHGEHAAAVRHRDEARQELAAASQRVEAAETELDDARRRLAEIAERLSDAEADLRRIEPVLQRSRETARAERQAAVSRIAELRAEIDGERGHVREAERKRVEAAEYADSLQRALETMEASGTWRAGLMVKRLLSPATKVAKAVRNRGRGPTEPAPLALPGAPESPGGTVAAPLMPPMADLEENLDVRMRYESAVRSESFSGHARRKVALLVWTLDFDEGRGDLYVAVGLGLQLQALGDEVVYVPRDRWSRIPEDADVTIAMIHSAEPLVFPAGTRRVAWIRNHTDTWIDRGRLALYDAVLCSSEASRAAVDEHLRGSVPTGILRIGVDTDLFSAGSEARSGVVSTVNQWGPPRDVLSALAAAESIDFPLALHGHFKGLASELEPYIGPPVSFFALPELYHRAEIVLDDFNHTTRALGNVNSRMYEALACGATVVTNSRRGMKEIGLDEVPAWSTPPQLVQRVEALLADPGAAERTAELSRLVRERHSWEVRARELDEFLNTLDAVPASRTVLGFWPDYRATNPYQDVLYGDLPQGVAPVAIENQFEFTEGRVVTDRGGRFVLHLHWTAPIIGLTADRDEAKARVARFLEKLDELADGGTKILWTIHNELPHECRFQDLELQLRQEIVDRADLIHVMSEAGKTLLGASLELPESRTVIIPHPSYEGVYPDVVTRESARLDLGIDDRDHVILFLGDPRPYKGLPLLLDAFDRARAADPLLHLLIATPIEKAGAELATRMETMPGVTVIPNRLADEDLQLPLRASDVVAMPYSRSLNSGALLLGLTFGRSVIMAAGQPPSELVDDRCARTFVPEDVSSLTTAILDSRELSGADAETASREVAMQFSPKAVAATFGEHLGSLI